MARRRKAAEDPFADLATKLEILERELAVQRKAMERLKEMARTPHVQSEPVRVLPVRKTA